MGKQQTILVVEDNNFVRMQAVSFLKDVSMEPMGEFEFVSIDTSTRLSDTSTLSHGRSEHNHIGESRRAGRGDSLNEIRTTRMFHFNGRPFSRKRRAK